MVWTWLLQFWQPRRKFQTFCELARKNYLIIRKNTIVTFLSTKLSFPQFISLNTPNAVLATLLINFCQTTESFICSKSEKDCEFSKTYFLCFFFRPCNLIFWQHCRMSTAKKSKCFCSYPKVFEKSTIFEIKSAKSTSDTQTHSSNKPANLSGQKSKKNNSKSERKVTATKFSTKSIFPQIVSWETAKVAWQRCRSFSVKLLNFFRFKSEKYAKLEVFQKKVPDCFSRKRRIQFWQLCGSTFAKTARRSHSK